MSSLHNIIGSCAVAGLNEKELVWWGDEIENLPELCFLPDRHLEHQDDPEKEAEMKKYCLMDDGTLVPHCPTDDSGNWCIFSGSGMEDILIDRVVSYYVGKIFECTDKGDMHSAACFTGVLSHYVQDNSVPVHIVNNLQLNQLFPEKDGRYVHYHYRVDSLPFEAEKIEIKHCLLGSDREEFIFNLICRIKLNRMNALPLLVPLLGAIDSGNIGEQRRISNIYNGSALELTIALWHTLYALSTGDFDTAYSLPPQKMRLSRNVPVYEVAPIFNRENFRRFGIEFYPTLYTQADPERSYIGVAPYRYEPALNKVYGKGGMLVPIQLQNGDKVEAYQDCIAVSGYGLSVFDTPGSLFDRLEVTAGLHPVSDAGKVVRFSILLDCASGLKLAFQEDKREHGPSSFVSIALPEDCRRTFFVVNGGAALTSALWCDPIVFKKS